MPPDGQPVTLSARGGFGGSRPGQCDLNNRNFRELRHVLDQRHPYSAGDLRSPRLVEPRAAQSAGQIALAAAPIVAVLSLGVAEAETGLLQTALTAPFVLFAIPAGLLTDHIPRRTLMAGAEGDPRAGKLSAASCAAAAGVRDPVHFQRWLVLRAPSRAIG